MTIRKGKVKIPKYRTKRPHEVKLLTNLKGVWKFKGEKEIPFEFLRSGKSGLRLKVKVPEVMGERAWRAFSRFLLFNFTHVREKVPGWLKKDPEYVAFKRKQRWLRRKSRRRCFLQPNPIPKVLSPLTPIPEEETSTGPSADLQTVAKAVLKSSKTPKEPT